jgi:hypothetical protein
MSDFWDAIEPYNNVAPAEREGGPQRSDVGTLPEGDYEFEVADAAQKMGGRKDQPAQPMLVLGCRVVLPSTHAGLVLERLYWLSDEGAVGRCFADLVILGMDGTTQFGPTLKEFLPKLPGRRFKGTRKDGGVNQKTGGPFHNLYVNQLLGGAAMPQPRVPQQQPPRPPRSAAQMAAPSLPNGNTDDSPIPF